MQYGTLLVSARNIYLLQIPSTGLPVEFEDLFLTAVDGTFISVDCLFCGINVVVPSGCQVYCPSTEFNFSKTKTFYTLKSLDCYH